MPARYDEGEEVYVRTTIELPEAVYRQSERLARTKGSSVEELIVQTLERAFAAESNLVQNSKRVKLPLVPSRQPGTLDLTDFDFDDLLA